MPQQIVYVDDFPIDCVLTETHEIENEVTTFPVETGGNVNDHVISKPRKVTLDGVVSDTPIGDMAGIRDSLVNVGDQLALGAGIASALPSRVALAKLESLDDSKRAVVLLTTIKEYKDMVLEHLSVPVSKETTGILRFTATFVHVTFRSLKRTKVTVAAASQGGGLGNKSGPPQLLKAIRCTQRSQVTGACTASEAVTFNEISGNWLHPNGKPLSDDELAAWKSDMDFRNDRTTTFDRSQGTWVDAKTKQPIAKHPDRVYYQPGEQDPHQQGKLADDFWDRHGWLSDD